MITTLYDVSRRTGLSFESIKDSIESGDLQGEIIPHNEHNMIITDDAAVNDFLDGLEMIS